MTTIDGQAIAIRRANLHDRDAITAMFAEDMADLGETPDPDALAAVAARMIESPLVYVFFAHRGSEAAGVVVAGEFLSIKFPGRALWIEELYVRPDFRRHGLGRLLVTELLEVAEADGIVGVELEAYRMNTAASVLYRSLGFRRMARERYSYSMHDDE
jgi:ribosomal protein S18 acetylase RimI-like enzyme